MKKYCNVSAINEKAAKETKDEFFIKRSKYRF